MPSSSKMDEVLQQLVSPLIQALRWKKDLLAWVWFLQTLLNDLNADEMQEVFQQLQLTPRKKERIIHALQEQSPKLSKPD